MKKHIGLMMASSALSIAIALPAAADSAPSAAPSATAVGEIIVTARRKDESLSKTPLTVAVLGTEQLAKQQIVTESDLRTAVPGLSVRTRTS
jgi:iron complex outermembrane receptor protein